MGRLVNRIWHTSLAVAIVWQPLVLALLLLLNDLELIGQVILDHQVLTELTKEQVTALTFVSAETGATAYSVTYLTTGSNGQPDTASGLIVLPEDKSVNRLISYQYADTEGLDLIPSKLNPEGTLAILYAGQGYIVSVTDYLGHGASRGFHPYVHASTQASAALDLLIGAKEFAHDNGFDQIQQIFITGYSQGAHATMELARSIEERITDDLWLTASACNAGPYSLSGVMRNLMLDTVAYRVPAFLPYLILGYQTIYGDIFQEIGEVFKSNYVPQIESFFRKEINRSTLNEFLVSELTDDVGSSVPKAMIQEEFLQDFESDTLHPLNLRLQENDTYRWSPQTPMRLFYCNGDGQVPAENSIIARDYMIANNAPDVEAIEVSPLASHGECVAPTIAATLSFFNSFRTTSTSHIDQELDVVLHPNPAFNHLYLGELSIPAQAKIFTSYGQLVYDQLISPNVPILLGNLSDGIYYLQVDTAEKSKVLRFIIAR